MKSFNCSARTRTRNRARASKNFGILMLCGGMYPEYAGGSEIQVFNLACRLAERRYDVHVITQTKNTLNETPYPKTPFTKISLKPWPKPFGTISYLLKSLISSYNFKKQIEIIHAYSAEYPMIAAFLFSLFNHKPYIISCQGSDIRIYSRKFLYRAFQLPFLRNAKKIVTVSHEIAEILIDKYGISRQKIIVVGSAYDDRITEEIANIKTYTKNIKLTRIICVANLKAVKDHITLLQGFAKLTKRINAVQLLLIGDGPLRKKLDDFCTQNNLYNVKFLGRLPHKDALEHVANSDIFILTSIEEGMPNAIIEALALRKPVIATRVGGIPEIVKDRFNGLLIPPRSPEHVDKALYTLLNDQNLYRKLSRNAIKSVRRYSWSNITSIYENIYSDLLSSS